MPTSRIQSILNYLTIPQVVNEEVDTQVTDTLTAAVFDHSAGGFAGRIVASDYGLHFLSAGFAETYEFEPPGVDDVGLIAVVATTAYPHTVTGPFVQGTTATFGGEVGDAMLVYVGNGQLFIVGMLNVTLASSIFDHSSGGFAGRLIPSDYGLHYLSASAADAYEFDTPDSADFGLITVVATTAFAHTLDGPFVGGFTTATFGGAVGDAMQVQVADGQLFVVSMVNVTLS